MKQIFYFPTPSGENHTLPVDFWDWNDPFMLAGKKQVTGDKASGTTQSEDDASDNLTATYWG